MATVEERLARVEAMLEQLAPGDSFSPSAGQHIDAQGHVTYDFEGHVKADGLDLIASTGTIPFDDQKVRWLRQDDGSYVAFIGAFGPFDNGAVRTHQLVQEVRAHNNLPGYSIREVLEVPEGDGLSGSAGPRATLDVFTSDIIGSTSNFRRTVLDANMNTDYMLARGCHAFLFSAAAVNIANTATAVVRLDLNVWDITDVPDGLTGYEVQRPAAGGSAWTCRREGIYMAHCLADGPVAGFGFAPSVRQNGVFVAGINTNATAPKYWFRPLACAVGDTVQIAVTNSTGAAGNFTGWLMISRIGSLSWLA